MYIEVKNINGENIPYKVKRIAVYDMDGGEIVFHHSDVEDIFFEESESFDDLVYIEPNRPCHIDVKTLSDDQKSFLDNNLTWYDNDRFSDEIEEYGYLYYDGGWCLTETCSIEQIFFNDIFKEKHNV